MKATVKFSKAAEKIADEIGTDMETAEVMAKQLQNVHPDLLPIAESWFAGQPVTYAVDGISLERIMQQRGVTYVEALFHMSVLLKQPQFRVLYRGTCHD